MLKTFVEYLASVVPGQLDDLPTVNTVRTHMWTFMATWKRRAGTEVQPRVRKQVMEYMLSTEFGAKFPLSTKACEKHVAMPVDCEIILEKIWSEKTYFKTTREQLQAAVLVILQSITVERPGTIVESNAHRGTNESLLHSDIEVRVRPNADRPYEQDVSVVVTFRLLKGHRNEDAFKKSVMFYPEPAQMRFMCPVMALLALQLQDGVFEDVKTIEDIVRPAAPLTCAHVLRQKAAWAGVPVFRTSTFVNRAWSTSPTEAITYSQYDGYLRYFSLKAGFHGMDRITAGPPPVLLLTWYTLRLTERVTSYCIRRSINVVAQEVTREERESWMNHQEGSRIYASKLWRHNLGLIHSSTALCTVCSIQGHDYGRRPTRADAWSL